MDHKEAVERFEYAIRTEETNRDEALEDMRFSSGEQWPDAERARRIQAQRPCLTINMTGQYLRRVTGAVRSNPPSIKVIASDDGGDEQKQSAEVREGLLRHIEHRSRGRWQYVQAVENAATCGIGHIRVSTEYDERDPFRQEIRFNSVSDPLSVLYDPDARRLTKEDGEYCFVTGMMSPEAFERKYPDAGKVDFQRDNTEVNTRYWTAAETVRVCEMFRRKPVKKKLLLVSNGDRVDVTGRKRDEIEQFRLTLLGQGLDIADEADWETHQVVRSVLSGIDYLEEEADFPSMYLPLIPVIGEEIHVGETVIRRGMVRQLRDPQRLYNYWRTAAAEMVALAPKAPFLATAAQIGPYKTMWDNAHLGPDAYRLYQPDPDAPNAMPVRQPSPDPPNAMWQEASVARDDMKGATGIYDSALGAPSNETSGRAILARQREADIGTFLYIDNLRHSVERLGVVLLDMMPRVYDTERTLAIQEESGETKPLVVNRTLPTGEVENEMKPGAYEVRVSTGPSFQSKREETAEAMIELIRAFPQLMQIAGDVLIENLDFPRADEIAERLKAMMAQGQQQGPTPEQQMEMQKAEIDAAKAQASIAKDTASAQKTMTEAEGQALDNLAARLGLGV